MRKSWPLFVMAIVLLLFIVGISDCSKDGRGDISDAVAGVRG